MLGWTPDTFWSATTWDLHAALDGYAIRTGARRDSGLDENVVAELVTLLEGDAV